jgi:hypothetical protein
MGAKNVHELNKRILEASPAKVRHVLISICAEWWVKKGKLDFDKELNSDTLEAVTTILHTNGFCPDEGK